MKFDESKNSVKLISKLALLPLRVPWFRKRVRFALQQEYFAESKHYVPISAGCLAPILHPDFWYSFEEIFFSGEYSGTGNRYPLPTRWLDIGCHAGFFSLFVLRERRLLGNFDPVDALLIDGDSRVLSQIEHLASINNVTGQLRFVHGAISVKSGDLQFIERECMASGLEENPASRSSGVVRKVPVLTSDDILRRTSGPFDLVKIDIEGGEYDFLIGYADILRQTNCILLEWHSWHRGGGGLPQIKQLAADLGFTAQNEFIPAHPVQVGGKPAYCGVLLLRREMA